MPALYRKFRPCVFDDVIGQKNVTEALKNQIKKGRVGHAYLFTGSRGTGKTTCAKIFARAVNCLNPVDGSPCGKCEVCRRLESSSAVDIIELDAASNNGVDEIRDIREKVKYAPVAAAKKVYIIDEAHMLTAGAFNALLKTLEEPPSHVVFILATTEAHKLPATILSRCMRFDFRLIPTDEIYELVKKIYSSEGVRAEDSAIRLIAKAGEGSARDALSIADRCMGSSDGAITYETVSDILGVSGWETMSTLVSNIDSCDIGAALDTLDKLASSGKSMGLIAKELASYARDVLVVKSGGINSVVAGEDKIGMLREDAEKYSAELLITIMKTFSQLDAELRYSVSPRIVLECAIVSACKLLSTDFTAFAERVLRLEKKLADISSGVTEISVRKTNEQVHGESVDKTALPRDPYKCWGKMLTFLRQNESMTVFSAAGEQDDLELNEDRLTVYACDEDSFMILSTPEATEALSRAAKFVHPRLNTVIEKRDGGVDMDNEIARIKAIAGNAKININKR